jgi:hypothetical protein
MGHIRLGAIPKSKAWSQVVSVLTKAAQASERSSTEAAFRSLPSAGFPEQGQPKSASAPFLEKGVADIASETLVAAEKALNKASDDLGFRYSFFLLTRIASASRSADWYDALREYGVHIGPTSTAFDLTTGFQEAVDSYVTRRGRPTDASEIAQKAAGEVLAERIGERAETLFGNSGAELQAAVRRFSTRAGFGELARNFFASFLSRHLNFYLSRITAAELATGTIGELRHVTEFNTALRQHCYESAAILEDFVGEWYSKAEYQQSLTQQSAGNAAYVALQKLQAEIRSQRERG